MNFMTLEIGQWFKKITQTYTTSIFIALISFLSIAILSKYFGATGLADVGVFLFILSIILTLSAVFGSSAIVYVLPRQNIGAVYVVSSIWAVLASFGFMAMFYAVNPNYPYVKWLLIIAVIQSLFVNNLAIVLAKNKIKTYNIVRFFPPFLLFLVLAFTYFNHKTIAINFYFYSLTFSYILPLIYLSFRLLPQVGKCNFNLKVLINTTALFFNFGGFSQLTNAFQLLNYRISYYFLFLFCTKQEIGVMFLTLSMVDAVWLFKNSIAALKFLETATENGKNAIESNFKLTKLSLLATLLLCLLVLVLPNSLYVYLLGKDFYEVKKTFALMLPGVLIMATSAVIANYFSGLGRVKINLIAAIVGFLVFVPGVYFLTKNYGLYGAALANNIPLVLGSLVVFYYYYLHQKKLKL